MSHIKVYVKGRLYILTRKIQNTQLRKILSPCNMLTWRHSSPLCSLHVYGTTDTDWTALIFFVACSSKTVISIRQYCCHPEDNLNLMLTTSLDGSEQLYFSVNPLYGGGILIKLSKDA